MRGERFRSRVVSRIDVLRRNPDLLLVAVLFLAMALGSRAFSKSVQIGPIYVTELLVALAGGLALVRLGARESWTALRRLPLLALGLIWLVGVIATLRGARDYGFSQMTDDIGLIDYSLVLPLFALVVTDRKRYETMFSVLVACGFVGMAAFFVLFSVDQVAGTADTLFTVVPVAYGLTIAFAIAWIVSRMSNGVRTPLWLAALVPFGLILMGISTVRSLWLVAIVMLVVIALLAPAGRRLLSLAAVAGLLAVSLPIALGVEVVLDHSLGGVAPDTEVADTGTVTGGDSGDGGGGGGGGGETQISREITSIGGGGDTGESANVSWRIAYWKELISRVPSDPLLGVGFGRPAAFEWHDVRYDFRDDDPTTTLDNAGPHNSFVSWIYRLGVPAFLALLFVMFVAARNALRALRDGTLGPQRRTIVTTLVGMLCAGTVVSGFNESLTGPFLSIFFWAPLGMLLLWPSVGPSAQDEAESLSADEPAPAR